MLSLLIRGAVQRRIVSILEKYGKPFSRIEILDEIIEEDTDDGVRLWFRFIIHTCDASGIVNLFNKYFYSVSKCQSIETIASADKGRVSLSAYATISNDMADSLL